MKVFKLIVAILTIISAVIYFASSDKDVKNIAFIFEMIGLAIQIFVV